MKKYLLALLVVFTLFACDPFKDLPKGATLTDKVKFYQVGTEISAQQFIKEVILNEEYIQFSGGDLSKVSFELISAVDTSTVGKKKIAFKMITKDKGFTELYIYIFVYQDSVQEFPMEPAIPIETVFFSSPTITALDTDLSCTLEPKFTPEGTNQRDFLFVSKNPEIAEVDVDGVVRRANPTAHGNVEIIVTSYYNPSISTKVTVSFPPARFPITALAFQGSPILITTAEDSVSLILEKTPSYTTDTEFTWTLSPDTIASVIDGVVTRKQYGTVTLKVASVASPSVYVEVDIKFVTTDITSARFSTLGPIRTLDSTVTLPDLVLFPPSTPDTEFEWESSNDDIATVADGVVTRLKPGEVTITATNVKNPSVFAEIDVIFDKLADQQIVLSGFSSTTGLNGQHNLLLALDFETDDLPSGVSVTGQASFKGFLAGSSEQVSLYVPKTLIEGWNYVELRARSVGSPNVWMRFETTSVGGGGLGVPSSPVTLLRNNPAKWGSGWHPALVTGMDADGTTHVLGYAFKSSQGYMANDRTQMNFMNCGGFFNAISSSEYNVWRLSIEDPGLQIDYVAFYN